MKQIHANKKRSKLIKSQLNLSVCRKKGLFKELVEQQKFDWMNDDHRDILRYNLSFCILPQEEARLATPSLPFLSCTLSLEWCMHGFD